MADRNDPGPCEKCRLYYPDCECASLPRHEHHYRQKYTFSDGPEVRARFECSCGDSFTSRSD